MPRRWLFKTEPSEFSYHDLERQKRTVWDGVSNNLALKNLREVRLGDQILIYHSGNDKAIVGLAEAVSDPYPDPKENDDKVVVVNITPKRKFNQPIPLAKIKVADALREFDLVRLPRLSVMPVDDKQWQVLLDMFA
ncbi:MAG: EVE domain-containing protein [Acidobacteria bacterium]|nr:EVE domain-containing protein [Acidobacteriota bacterium]